MNKKTFWILFAGTFLFLILSFGTFFLYTYTFTKIPKPISQDPEELHHLQTIRETHYPQKILHTTSYTPQNQPEEVFAKAAILIDSKTGTVLYEKNADTKIPPASMTKIAVMYVVMQEIDKGTISLQDQVKLPPESWAINLPSDASLMFLAEGQKVTLNELLLGLAIASGNDAAIAVAHHVSGSVENFIERMNKEMVLLGLENTHFVEPSGYSEKNITTARDFATLARVYIEKYPESLKNYHSAQRIEYPQNHNLASWHQPNQAIIQYNTNKALKVIPGADGLKTGFIYESGYNLSFTAERNGTRFISVTMGGPGYGTVEGNKYRLLDAQNLIEWAFGNFETVTSEQRQLSSLPIFGGKERYVPLTILMPSHITKPLSLTKEDSYAEKIDLPPYLENSVEKGQQIGEYTLLHNNIPYATMPIIATENVAEANSLKKFIDSLAKKLLF